MVCRPISLQARITRTAISPRLAISTFWKHCAACAVLALALTAVRAREDIAFEANCCSVAPRKVLLLEVALLLQFLSLATGLKAVTRPVAANWRTYVAHAD